MAVDKLVDSTQLDTDLTSVANAIRTKGGTSASLAFPADFILAIGAIPTGGGGVQSGSYTPTGALKTFSLSMATAPQHLVMYSINADFGTAAAWNTQYLIWNTDDQLIYLSHYSTSNFRAQTAGTVTYSNGSLTIDSLSDGLRNSKIYYWYAW